MRRPITIGEQAMTARDTLARAIGLFHPLFGSDRERIIDAGLATDDEFGPHGRALAGEGDSPTYTYIGSRWTVEYREGRPHLIEAVDVPPDAPRSAVAEDEHRFALVVHVLETMRGRTLGPERVGEMRADWAPVWAEAERRDRQEPGRGSAAIEWHERQRTRLGRAQGILRAPSVLPYLMPGQAIGEGDPLAIGRYLVVTLCRMDGDVTGCHVGHADDAGELLAEVARHVSEQRAPIGAYDLDSEAYLDGVGITITVSLTDDPETTHQRSVTDEQN